MNTGLSEQGPIAGTVGAAELTENAENFGVWNRLVCEVPWVVDLGLCGDVFHVDDCLTLSAGASIFFSYK